MKKPARKERARYVAPGMGRPDDEFEVRITLGYVREDGKHIKLKGQARVPTDRNHDLFRAVAKATAHICMTKHLFLEPGGISTLEFTSIKRVRVPKSDVPF